MSTPVGDPAESGVEAGISRAARHGLTIEIAYVNGAPRYPDELSLPLTFTRALLESGEASERFCELFAEVLSVAAIARYSYGDAPLTESAVREYLNHSSDIFNSWRHA